MRRVLTTLLAALVGTVVALAVSLAFAPAAKPQASPVTMNVVIIDDAVRTKLAKAWDKSARNPFQVERGYCARWDTMPFAGETVYRVYAADTPDVVGAASTDSIVVGCAAKPNVVLLHIHTPATCVSETECVLGGSDAYECFPSRFDQAALDKSTDAFALIQCDRKAVVFYFPKPK